MSISTKAKLLDLADKMQSTIDAKRAPMTQNWTRRRQAQKDAQNRDADRLETVQRGLRAIAEAWGRGRDRIPEKLLKVKTKAAVELVLGHTWGSREEIEAKWARLGITTELGRTEARNGLSLLMGDVSDIEAARKARETQGERDANLRASKRPGFFPTPDALAEEVIRLAQIDADRHLTLEPSSGMGDLAKRVPGRLVCVEIAPDLAEITREQCPDAQVLNEDFDKVVIGGEIERVVMNPPFERGAAIRHTRRAWGMLVDGGRLVAILPNTAEARELAEEWGGEWIDKGAAFSGAGAFKSTGVHVGILVADK